MAHKTVQRQLDETFVKAGAGPLGEHILDKRARQPERDETA
jgi:hypothetical protein